MEIGFEKDRLKTGTPARVDSRTVNYKGLEVQAGDEDVRWFSFDPSVRPLSIVCSGYRLKTSFRRICNLYINFNFLRIPWLDARSIPYDGWSL